MDIRSVSLINAKCVTGGHGINVVADYLFEEADFENALMLIIPGGTVKFNEHNGLKRELVKFAEQGKPLAAICAAPMVFGGLGLLKGIGATCYQGFEKYLIGADVCKSPIVIEKNITTAKAVGHTFYFALELLKQLKGKKVAEDVGRKMMLIK